MSDGTRYDLDVPTPPSLDTLPGWTEDRYGTPIGESLQRFQQETLERVHADVIRAIVRWSEDLGITPEQWVERYYVELTFGPIELNPFVPARVSYTLTPKIRENDEPIVVVGKSQR